MSGKDDDLAAATRPTDADLRAYLDGEHGPPSLEVVAIVQDNLERAIREGDGGCCCESSPPEFGGNLPHRACPLHGEGPKP